MNILFISIFAVASLSLLPTKILGTTEVQEPPQALPLTSQTQATINTGGGEIWQEDDREVLIRNERGTKNNNNGNGSGTGKRGKNKKLKHKSLDITTKQIDSNINVSDIINHDNNNNSTKIHNNIQNHKKQQQQHQFDNQQKHQNHGKHKKNFKTTLDNEQIPSSCRYLKSPWTECDAKTNTRSRTLTLKKGEDVCVPTRTIQKKCKKACRYEKGSWSECTTGQMSRTDKLKSTSDPTCQTTRVVNKNCNPGKSKDKSNKERKNKDKGARKGRA